MLPIMDLLIPISTLVFVFALTLYLLLVHHHRAARGSHCFKSYPVVGSFLHLLANRHCFLEWSTAVLSSAPTNTAVFFRPGGAHGVITADAANVEYILKTNFTNYPKGPRFISILSDFLGGGIFNADGNLWRVQRKTASFEFKKRSLRCFVMECVQSEIQTRLIPILKLASKSGQILDIQDVLERFAFNNVCKLAFNVDPGCLSGDGLGELEFMQPFGEATVLSEARFFSAHPFLWKVKRYFCVGSERKLKESIRIVHDFADKIVCRRLEDGESENQEDLLSRFISTGEHSIDFLRDVVVSFILAGRDTTSSGLSWFFWLLSVYPNMTEKIRNEVKTVRIRSGKLVGDPFELEDLKGMHYLHGAISESLRLYPPVPVDTKASLDDDILPDGTKVKKGWFVMYHTYAMGRMEKIWGKDCLEFRPERWVENGMYKEDSPYRYPVFNGGPRTCLGKEMAILQMEYIVASVIEQFELQVVGNEKGFPPQYQTSLTLRIRDGLRVRVKERLEARASPNIET